MSSQPPLTIPWAGGPPRAAGPAGPAGPPGDTTGAVLDAATKQYVDAQIATLETKIQTLAARQQVADFATPADPTGTASTTFLMMGIGVSVAFTPAAGSTRAIVLLAGQIANTNNNGITNVQMYYGTGTPPANGAAVTGTAVGGSVSFVATSGGGAYTPFSESVLLLSLTPGTAYWVDLALASPGAGTGSVRSLDITIFSLIDAIPGL